MSAGGARLRGFAPLAATPTPGHPHRTVARPPPRAYTFSDLKI